MGEPVPVWRVPLIAAFISQGLLVRPSEVAMPCQKVSLCPKLDVIEAFSSSRSSDESVGAHEWETHSAVNGQRLVDVNGSEVVVSVSGTWEEGGVGLRRLGQNTLKGRDVVLPLADCEVVPDKETFVRPLAPKKCKADR